VHKLGARTEEVLAIVQHDQNTPVLEGADEAVDEGPIRLLANLHRRRNSLDNKRVIGTR
jgi:hypothetical protein